MVSYDIDSLDVGLLFLHSIYFHDGATYIQSTVPF